MHLGSFLKVIRKFRKQPATELCRELGRVRSYLSKMESGHTAVTQTDLALILEYIDQTHNKEFFDYLWHGHHASIRLSLHDPRVPESLKQLAILYANGKYPDESELQAILEKYVPKVPEDIQEIIRYQQAHTTA